MTPELRTTPTGTTFVCPGCARPLVRGDISITADALLVVELFALGCSAHHELRLAVDGNVTVVSTRCIEAPGPLFPDPTPES